MSFKVLATPMEVPKELHDIDEIDEWVRSTLLIRRIKKPYLRYDALMGESRMNIRVHEN